MNSNKRHNSSIEIYGPILSRGHHCMAVSNGTKIVIIDFLALNDRQLLQSEPALTAMTARRPNRPDLKTAYTAAGLAKRLWNF